MTARFAAATANGQVIGITGQDPVPRLGQQDDAGIDRVGGAGLTEQDTGLTAVLVIDGAQQPRQIGLTAVPVPPDLGGYHRVVSNSALRF